MRAGISTREAYVGMPITHGASFRKYLWERFVSKLPLPMAALFGCAILTGGGEQLTKQHRVGSVRGALAHAVLAVIGAGCAAPAASTTIELWTEVSDACVLMRSPSSVARRPF